MNDGGPAFPPHDAREGMSLRDYFAAEAMAAWLSTFSESSHPAIGENSESKLKSFASGAYAIADAMIAHRDKNK